MTTPLAHPSVNWLAISPELALAAAGIAIVMVRSVLRRRINTTPLCAVLGIAGIVAAGAVEYRLWHDLRHHQAITTVAGMVRVDLFGVYLGVVVLSATILALLLSVAYLQREQLDAPEYLALILLSAAGMLIMTTANDLIVVFLALEVLSIPLYVLAAFDRRRLTSQEAGLKYFILGAFSSAIFLYGVALTYGATGTTSLTGIADFLSKNTLLDQGTLLAGIAMLLVGLGFKVAAVPFHMWTPDVYQGAPTPITSFMSAATKAAAFAALLRVFGVAFPLYRTDWRPAVWALAVLSLASPMMTMRMPKARPSMVLFAALGWSVIVILAMVGIVESYSQVGFSSASEFSKYLFGTSAYPGALSYIPWLYDAMLGLFVLTAIVAAAAAFTARSKARSG